MGQYYKAVLLAESQKPELIRIAVSTSIYCGMKLMEHSYIDTEYMCTVEYLLCPMGLFYKSRLVWAGDYADPEPDTEENLYTQSLSKECVPYTPDHLREEVKSYPYIVNHTMQQYVSKEGRIIHPLSLLTAEGNGRGGGDYGGTYQHLIGSWKRCIISLEKNPPEDYIELECDFEEIR